MFKESYGGPISDIRAVRGDLCFIADDPYSVPVPHIYRYFIVNGDGLHDGKYIMIPV